MSIELALPVSVGDNGAWWMQRAGLLPGGGVARGAHRGLCAIPVVKHLNCFLPSRSGLYEFGGYSFLGVLQQDWKYFNLNSNMLPSPIAAVCTSSAPIPFWACTAAPRATLSPAFVTRRTAWVSFLPSSSWSGSFSCRWPGTWSRRVSVILHLCGIDEASVRMLDEDVCLMKMSEQEARAHKL